MENDIQVSLVPVDWLSEVIYQVDQEIDEQYAGYIIMDDSSEVVLMIDTGDFNPYDKDGYTDGNRIVFFWVRG